jgi:hypothetical protein
LSASTSATAVGSSTTSFRRRRRAASPCLWRLPVGKAEPDGATKTWLHLPFRSREGLQHRLHTRSWCKNHRLAGLQLEPPMEPEPEPYQIGPSFLAPTLRPPPPWLRIRVQHIPGGHTSGSAHASPGAERAR